MKTTKQWLHEVKTVPGKMRDWLERQYVGEALATDRITALAAEYTNSHPARYTVLARIASDEAKHTKWIAELLEHRNIPLPSVSMDGTRYWEPILSNLHTFDEIAGAGHHAETMRLSRIEALADDTEMDQDIRDIFAKILIDEQFHAAAFAKLSSPAAIEKTRPMHEAGLKLLGLVV